MAGIGDVLAKTAGKGAGVSTVSRYCDVSSYVWFIHVIGYYFVHGTFEIEIYT